MSFTIRPFAPEQYPGLCELVNAVDPEARSTVEELRYHDEHRDPKCRRERFVAEWDGCVAGAATYANASAAYHPRKFDVGVRVLPRLQGRGVGGALYRRLLEALEP